MRNENIRFKEFAKIVSKGITQLSLDLGKTKNYLAQYMANDKLVGIELLSEIQLKYNLSIDWLLTGKGNMFINEKLPNTENVEVLESKSSKVPIMTNENMSEILERLSNIEKKLEEVES